MPDGKDKQPSFSQLTGLPEFGAAPNPSAPKVPVAPAGTPTPELPKEYYTQEREQEKALQAWKGIINTAVRYRGGLEQEARAYYGNLPATQQDITSYMNELHAGNVETNRQREQEATKKFMDVYGDAHYRNSLVGLDEYKPLIDNTRLIKPTEDGTGRVASYDFANNKTTRYSEEDMAKLDKRGSSRSDAAPVDMDDILDKNDNVSPEFMRRLVEATGGDQKKMRQMFRDTMEGKRNQWSNPGNPSIEESESQARMDELHSSVLGYPAYYMTRFGQGLHSGLHSTGNFLVNVGLGGYLDLATGGDYDAGKKYVEAMRNFNRANPSTTARDESQDWFNPDHILSSGLHMTGEFIPALMTGEGNIAKGVSRVLLRQGFREGLAGAAALSAAEKTLAFGDTFGGRLMQNSLHMMKSAFPQVYAGYVEDGLHKGYSTDEALARAFPRAIVNTIALSVPGSVARAGIAANAIPGKILASAAERTLAQRALGTASQFVKAPAAGGAAFAAGSLADSYQNFLEDKNEGRNEVSPNAGFVEYMNYEQAKHEGSIPKDVSFDEYRAMPEAQSFGYAHAFKDMAEQGMFGILWGVMEKAVHGHGVLPSPVQADYIHMAANDLTAFGKSVDKNVSRGTIDVVKGNALKAFVGRLKPTIDEAEARGYDHRSATQFAIEGERLKETAEAMKALTDQGSFVEHINADGKKEQVLYGPDPANPAIQSEAGGKALTAKIEDYQRSAKKSEQALQQLREGNYTKGRTISGEDMMRMAGKFSPGDGLRPGQAKAIIENGPYRTETQDITRFMDNPIVARYVGDMVNYRANSTTRERTAAEKFRSWQQRAQQNSKAEGAGAPLSASEYAWRAKNADIGIQAYGSPTDTNQVEGGLTITDANGKLTKFEPQNANPPIIGADGQVLDGAKRIAYNLVHGVSEMELATPLRIGDLAEHIADAHNDPLKPEEKSAELVGSVDPATPDAPVTVTKQPAEVTYTPEEGKVVSRAKALFLAEMNRSFSSRKPTAAEKAAGVTNKETRAYYVAAEHAIDNGVSKEAIHQMLDELSGGQLSPAMKEAFVNEISRDKAAGKPSPVKPAGEEPNLVGKFNAQVEAAGKDLSAILHGKQAVDSESVEREEEEDTPDPRLVGTKFWDAKENRLADGYRPNEAGFEEVTDYLDNQNAAPEQPASPATAPAAPAAPPVEQAPPGFVPVSDISSDHRFYREPVDEAKVKELMGEIQSGSFKDPVHLWTDKDGNTHVLHGRNRVEAARRAGWPFIKAKMRTDLDVKGAVKYARAQRQAAELHKDGQAAADAGEVLADHPVRYVTDNGKYSVFYDGTRLQVVNLATGQEAVAKYRSEAIKEAMGRYRFSQGVSISPDIFETIETGEQYGYAVLEHSFNPGQLATAWDMQEREPGLPEHSKERIIAEGLGRITTESWNRFGDRNNSQWAPAIRLHYLANDRSAEVVGIDVKAQELSNYAGFEITPQDIVDFIMSYPNGPREALREVETPLAIDIAAKFEKLTGFELTREVADHAMAQRRDGYSPAEKAIFDQEIEDNEQLRKLYEEAVANGTIDPSTEDVRDREGAGAPPEDGEGSEGEGSGPSSVDVATFRPGRVSVLASDQLVKEAGWTEGGHHGFDALHARLRQMFGKDMALVITDNQRTYEYYKDRHPEMIDPALALNAWYNPAQRAVYLNIEKCPPSAVLDELGHVWTGWARQHAPEIAAMGERLAEASVEFRYMEALMRGEEAAVPEGMNDIEADLWQRYAAYYGGRPDGRSILIEEVLTQAIQKQGQLLVPKAEKARNIKDDGGVKKGNWGAWLEALWQSVMKAAGFRKMDTREFSKLSLDKLEKGDGAKYDEEVQNRLGLFAKAVAEEIGQVSKPFQPGDADKVRPLTKKIAEPVDADVKKDKKGKVQKEAEEIDPALADQVGSAEKKPKIAAGEGEDGAPGSVEISGSPAVMERLSNISPADLKMVVEQTNPELIDRMLTLVPGTSHFARLAKAVPDETHRAEATLLDIIADPHLLASARDKQIMGALSGGMFPKLSGPIGEFYQALSEGLAKAFPDANISPEGFAKLMVRKANEQRKTLKLPEWGKVPGVEHEAEGEAAPEGEAQPKYTFKKLPEVLVNTDGTVNEFALQHWLAAAPRLINPTAENIARSIDALEQLNGALKDKMLHGTIEYFKSIAPQIDQLVTAQKAELQRWIEEQKARTTGYRGMSSAERIAFLDSKLRQLDLVKGTWDAWRLISDQYNGLLSGGGGKPGILQEHFIHGRAKVDQIKTIGSESPAEAPKAIKAPAKKGKALGEQRKKDLDSLLDLTKDLFSLPAQDVNHNDRFSLPAADPEIEGKRTAAAIRVVKSSIEEGSVKLADIVTDLHEAIGDKLDALYPYIKSAYLAYAGHASDEVLDQMDDLKAVRSFDYNNFKTQLQDARDTGDSVEPDSPRGGSENGVGTQDVQPANGSEAVGRPGSRGAQAGGEAPGDKPASGERLPNVHAPADRAPGNTNLFGEQSGHESVPADIANTGNNTGSGWYGHEGQVPPGGRRAAAVKFTADGRAGKYEPQLREQKAAERVPVIIGDRENIDQTLPWLMPTQRDDVHFAEVRLQKEDGYGALFANATGTGKTYLALGVIKRALRAGKTNVIVVVPNAPVIQEWLASAPNLGIELKKLKGITDAPDGVIITTYHNFYQNDALAKRKNDLLVIDEAHKIMASGDADETGRIHALRAMTLNPLGDYALAERWNRTLHNELKAIIKRLEGVDPEKYTSEDAKKLEDLREKWNAAVGQARTYIEANQGDARPRALFLSASPFAYRENVQWGEGFLFNYPKVERTGAWGEPGPYEQFMIQHFGYRMRYGKLTKPDADVNIDFMERAFNEHLHNQGAMSTRILHLESDYQRTFALTPTAVGHKIDEGLEWLREAKDGYYRPLSQLIQQRFKYLPRARLLESIKAHEAIPMIKKLQARGKKVVVFYDFNEGGAFSPFHLDPEQMDGYVSIDTPHGPKAIEIRQMLKQFHSERPDLAEIDLDGFGSPLQTLGAAFPDAGIVNGPENEKKKLLAIENFNNDAMPEANLLIVQSDAAEGWSAHDKSGRHERVIINLGQPVAPTKVIQQEGRIYRSGQHPESNSHFIYMNTGTMWERAAFASKIAERAGTAENLGMGKYARGLKASIVDAFNESNHYEPSDEDGRGTRDKDRAAALQGASEYERAKSLYYSQQKKNQQTKAREGVDYFATPEPIGFKMVEWAGIRPNEDVLEPSVGHGAIARWFPHDAHRTTIEQSNYLHGIAELNVLGAKAIHGSFESHHIYNKYDAIPMNPPYGHAGTTAMDHVKKAWGHLRPGGRIVALVPVGAFNAKFDKWAYETDHRGRQVNPDLHIAARILLPSSTFERAGTKVNTQILILDRAPHGRQPVGMTRNVDLTHIESNKELFDRLEGMQMPERMRDPKREPEGAPVPPQPEQPKPTPNPSPLAILTSGRRDAQLPAASAPAAEKPVLVPPVKVFHAKNQKDIWVVQIEKTRRLDAEEYAAVKKQATDIGGYYSSFKGNGAIPGFVFNTEEGAKRFHDQATAPASSEEGERFSIPIRPGASNEEKAAIEQLNAAHEEATKARTALRNKRADLNKRLMADSENLFGERKSTQAGAGLFDVRADAGAAANELTPLEARIAKADKEVDRLEKVLQDMTGKPTAQASLFSLPRREQEVIDEARSAADGDDVKGFDERMEALEQEGAHDPTALAARGELFSLPISLAKRAKVIVQTHQDYNAKEDNWIGNRDVAKVHASNLAIRFQDRIKESIGKRPGLLHPVDNKNWKKEWRDTDRAIHIYMDTKRDPTHLDLYDQAVKDAKQMLANPTLHTPHELESAKNIIAQEGIVAKSQKLTAAQKAIADDMLKEYDKIGQMALNSKVIRDVLDNYVSRAWDFGAGSSEEHQKFNTFTRHSLQRVLTTILEGYSRGYKLKIEGASNNLSSLYREISNVIENQNLIRQGLAIKDATGTTLFTTASDREGYARIENRNFRKWIPIGKLSDYSAKQRQGFGRDVMITEKGTVMKKVDVYAPKEIATSLNNILGKTSMDGKLVQGVTKFNAAVKQSILSYSGFHFIAFTREHMLSAGLMGKVPTNPISAYKTGQELIAAEDYHLTKLVHNGMTINRQQDFTEGVLQHNTWLSSRIDNMGGFPAEAKNKMLELNRQFHKYLFEHYGAGLKAFDGVALMKHEMAKNPTEDHNTIAERVGKIMNDSYGGLNWNRMRGSHLQNPTTRHLYSLLMLAPDWTIANLRFAKKAFERGDEGALYRKAWARVILRGTMLTALANAGLAFMDDTDDDGRPLSWAQAMARRYKKGWDTGRLRWTMVDITPLYHACGGDLDRRSYFSIFGAYTDVMKMAGAHKDKDGQWELGIAEFLSHKGSFITKAGSEALNGEDWQHKQFTTLDEMLGIDDKGVYMYDQQAHKRGDFNPETGKLYAKNTKGHVAGGPKGGKHKGDLVRTADYGGGVSVLKRPGTLPSFLGVQMRGMLPTSLQSLAAAWAGENDWAQFRFQALGTGVVTSRDPDSIEKKK